MFFACGWPSAFLLPLSDHEWLVEAICHPYDEYMLFVSNLHLYIWWQGQSSLLLAKSEIASAVSWISASWVNLEDQTYICTLDEDGSYYIFSVTFQKKEVHFQIPPQSADSFISLQPVPTATITAKYHTKSSFINCFCAVDGLLIGGTSTGNICIFDLRKQSTERFHLEKQLLIEMPDFLPKENEKQEIASTITEIAFAGGLFSFIFADGRAAVLPIAKKDETITTNHFHSVSESSSSQKKGKWLIQAGATKISYSPRHGTLAVGHESGEISLFQSIRIEKEDDEHYKQGESHTDFDIIRIFSLIHWGITSSKTGKVSQLSWSPHGNVLAVGWKDRGLSVWSLYGCKLMCTIPQYDSYENSENLIKKEPFYKGVDAMAWGIEGYTIWGYHSSLQRQLISIPFIKSQVVTNPSLHYSSTLLLQGADRIFQISKTNSHTSTMQHLQIPQEYLNDNWPIRLVSVNRNGQDIAVAGKRGFVIFNPIKNRWRMFGDRKQEKSINIMAMCWFKRSIIILNESFSRGVKILEILAFPHSHLSSSSILLRFPLHVDSTPLSIDCNDSHLMIFLQAGSILHYKLAIEFSRDGSLDVQSLLCSYISQTSSTGVHSLLSSLVLPPIPHLETKSEENIRKNSVAVPLSNDMNTECLLLDPITGRLSVHNPFHGVDTELAESVELFGFSGTQASQSSSISLENMLWAYGEEGIRIWYPFVSSESISGTSKDKPSLLSIPAEKSLRFDTEVYPLAFSHSQGIITGLSQVTVQQNENGSASFPRYTVAIRPQPFLHILLSHMLELEQTTMAKTVADSCTHLPHFEHSLELLLHEAIEHPKGPNYFASIFSFLQKFPSYPKIVVRCARKTDVSHWSDLFQFSEPPIDLFTMCMNRNFISSAASYLRVIQILHDVGRARKAGHLLLDYAVSHECMELIPDLLHFLEPHRYSENGDDDDFLQSEHVASEEEQEDFVKEILLCRFVRRSLVAFEYQKFLLFTSSISSYFSLGHWLRKEREQSAVVDNYRTAIDAFHRHFQIPYPHQFDEKEHLEGHSDIVLKARTRRAAANYSPSFTVFYPQPDSPTPSTPEMKGNRVSHMKLERRQVEVFTGAPMERKSSKGVLFVSRRASTTPEPSLPPEIWNDLGEFLIQAFNANCYDLSVILACVMINLPVLLLLLRAEPRGLNYLKKALYNHPSSPGYHRMIFFLERQCNAPSPLPE